MQILRISDRKRRFVNSSDFWSHPGGFGPTGASFGGLQMIAMKQLENDSARIANETIRLANDKARDAENAKVTAMVMAQNQQLMKSNQELARSNQQMTSQFMSFTTMVMDRLNQGQANSRPTAIPEISYVVHPMCDPSSSQDEFQGFHTQK